MKEADAQASSRHQDQKALISISRETVQTAEDAREIAMKRIDSLRADRERNASARGEADAKAQSARDSQGRANAEAVTADAVRQREEPATIQPILETRDTARGLVVNMSDVLFDSGKYTLRPLAREKLAKISGILLAYPALNLAVEGNTDSVGTEEYNQDLSVKRAESVRTFLTAQGVPSASTTSAGFGKTRPIASNDTADGRQQNRRVELVVSGEVIGTKIVSMKIVPVAGSPPPQPRQ